MASLFSMLKMFDNINIKDYNMRGNKREGENYDYKKKKFIN